jgi:hypothetical protein
LVWRVEGVLKQSIPLTCIAYLQRKRCLYVEYANIRSQINGFHRKKAKHSQTSKLTNQWGFTEKKTKNSQTSKQKMLITGMLITIMKITGMLITVMKITGMLMTCMLITGMLITRMLITGMLITGMLITGMLITGMLITRRIYV